MSKTANGSGNNEFQDTVIINGNSGGQVSIQAPTSNFNSYTFPLPTTIASAGNILTSNGPNTPMIWQSIGSLGGGTVSSVGLSVPAFLSVAGSPVTGAGTLAVTLSGTALPIANGGTASTTSTGSGSVVLAVQPTVTGCLTVAGSTTTPVVITTTSTGAFLQALTATASNNVITPGDITSLYVGTATNARNGGYFGFNFLANGSTSNYMTVGMNSKDRIMDFVADGSCRINFNLASTSTTTGSLKVAGGVGVVGQITSATHGYQGSTSGIITIQPQAVAGTYNFNLPITAGSSGQVLTSQGGGANAMTWTSATSGTVTSVNMTVPTFLSVSGNPITSAGTLALTLSGTALPVLNGGTGSTTSTGTGSVVLATSPTIATSLTVSGTTTNPLIVNTTATNISLDAINVLATNNTASNAITSMYIGQANNARNGGYFGFNYLTNSSTSNYMTIGMSSKDKIMDFVADGSCRINFNLASTSTTTGSLKVAGGVGVVGQITSATHGYQGSTSGIITIQPQAVAGTYNFNLPITAGSSGQVLTSQGGGANAMTWTSPGTGTVTSVNMTVPSFLSISGNPITTSGTLALTLSGTALPVLNGGTGVTTSTGNISILK
jgi:hypothetical protein